MKAHHISRPGLPAVVVMELVDIPKPDTPDAVGLSATMNEITSIYGDR
jgi:hypothetical protein